MKPYCDLDATGKKARKAMGKINCDKCPAKAKCDLLTFDVCTYVFEEGFRKGVQPKKERGEMQEKLTIRYMTPEEEMRYLISTHDDKRISTDSI